MQVHPGELTTVMYEFRNMQNRTMAAQAIPSYAPKQAMAHFNKLECFCFNEYTLKPGETKQWPVVFVIDPKLPKDVTTITLSYTFFEVGGKVPPAPAGGLRPTRGPGLAGAAAVSPPDGLKEAARAGRLVPADHAGGGLVVLRRPPLGRPRAGRAEAQPGARDHRRRHQRRAVRAALVLLVHWVIGSGVAA